MGGAESNHGAIVRSPTHSTSHRNTHSSTHRRDRGTPRKGLHAPAAHSNTHRTTHSNTHRPWSQPCEWKGPVGDAAHDRVVSRGRGLGKGYVRVILLLSGYDKRLPERPESAAGDRRRTPAPHSVSDVVRTGRRQRAARERHQAARGPRAVATTLRQHGAIVSAETLDRPHLASSPASWHPMCIPCECSDAPYCDPVQAVSAGPRRAPRSILPLTPSSCL